MYFKSVVIIPKPGLKLDPIGVHAPIFQALRDAGCEIYHFPGQGITLDASAPIRQISEDQFGAAGIDLCLALGGDGTMIGAARLCAPMGIPLIGVNLGTVGFLTDIPLAQSADLLPAMLSGQYELQGRTLLEGILMREGEEIARHYAFNDISLSRNDNASLIKYGLVIDSRLVTQTRADGIIVATPSGSTAYALSSGGPIIEPDTPTFALVPICPQNLSNRPLCVPDHRIIRLQTLESQSATVHWDGHARAPAQAGDEIICRKSMHSAKLLHPRGHDYFDTLRAKLHWNAGGL